jgi:hypothetical protein
MAVPNAGDSTELSQGGGSSAQPLDLGVSLEQAVNAASTSATPAPTPEPKPLAPVETPLTSAAVDNTPPVKKPSRLPRRGKMLATIVVALIALGVIGGLLFHMLKDHKTTSINAAQPSVSQQYSPVNIPLKGLTSQQVNDLESSGNPQLTVNGQLQVNGAIVISSSTQPTNPTAGQLYFNKTNGQLYFYNGTTFLDITATIKAVSSFQGQTGAVSLTAGSGISLNGTTITNDGVLGLSSDSSDLSVTRNADGTYTITDNSAPLGPAVELQDTSPGTVQSGNINIDGDIIAASFTGDGTNVTNVNAVTLQGNDSSYFTNASNISSGTLSDARLNTNVTQAGNTFNGNNELVELNGSGALPAVSGINLTNLNASAISSGTLNDLRLSPDVTIQGNTFNGPSQLLQATSLGYIPALNGSLITSLDASNISSGTIGDNYLSSNVALLNANQTFSGNDTFSNNIAVPGISPSGATLGIGSSTATLALQGNLSSSFTAISGSDNISVGFSGSPTGSITYDFDSSTTPGTYTICTSIGNCASAGGGVTTGGGTTNKLAKFTGAGSIGNSSITDTGTLVTISASGLVQAASTTAFEIQNSSSPDNLFIADTTNHRIAIDEASSTYTLGVGGTIDGTILYQNGNQVCDISGNCAGVGGEIGGAGTTGTIPIFTASGTIGNSSLTQSGSTVTGTNINVTGEYLVGGSQIASANLSDNSNIAKLNGTGPQTFTGNNKFTGTVDDENATNSTDAFEIQNATNGSLLIADTTDGRIGIGVQPGYPLDVAGDINISTGSSYLIDGVAICGPADTCAPSAGSSNYIQNSVSQQNNANFNIRSVSSSSAVAVLEGASGQTADLIDIDDGNGNNVFKVGNTGNVAIDPSTNAVNALQVQNAANTSTVLAADTSNLQVDISSLTAPTGLTTSLLSAPASPSATAHGTAGSTTYSYVVTAIFAGGYASAISSTATTTTANATSDHQLFKLRWPLVGPR